MGNDAYRSLDDVDESDYRTLTFPAGGATTPVDTPYGRRSVGDPSSRWASRSPTVPGTGVRQYWQYHDRPVVRDSRMSSSPDESVAPQPSQV